MTLGTNRSNLCVFRYENISQIQLKNLVVLQVNSVIDKITAKEGEWINKTMESQMIV